MSDEVWLMVGVSILASIAATTTIASFVLAAQVQSAKDQARHWEAEFNSLRHHTRRATDSLCELKDSIRELIDQE